MTTSTKIIPVWRNNFYKEISSLDAALTHYKLLSIDTEFPGFLRNTPRHAPLSERYRDLKYNVDNTNIIQLGITLSDDQGNIGGIWEFNFSEFDIQNDNYVEASIVLLKSNGLDFDKMKKDGIPKYVFAPRFLEMLTKHKHDNLKWVTFHGLYDLAYLVKLFTNHQLPPTDEAFAGGATWYFQTVFDIKVLAKQCEGLMGCEIGLSKLANILNVERIGESHNAGSDSLLTALVFARLREHYEIEEGDCEGLLYGMAPRMIKRPTKIIVPRYCQHLQILHPPTFVSPVPDVTTGLVFY